MFCLPVPHDKIETRTPWVIIAIIALEGLLLLPVLGGHSSEIFSQYGFTPAHATLITFFTGTLLHAGLLHYGGNMVFLWLFGRKVEATVGHLHFLACYVCCGAGGQLLYFLLNRHSEVPCIGASGAIAGVVGMYLVLFPSDRFDLQLYLGYWRVKSIPSTTKVAVGVWIGEQFVLALITTWAPVSSVAFWAHVGGFVAGMGLGYLYCVRVPAAQRPEIPVIEVPAEDNIPEPNHLIGLGLSNEKTQS